LVLAVLTQHIKVQAVLILFLVLSLQRVGALVVQAQLQAHLEVLVAVEVGLRQVVALELLIKDLLVVL
jgi:hypothetical protein